VEERRKVVFYLQKYFCYIIQILMNNSLRNARRDILRSLRRELRLSTSFCQNGAGHQVKTSFEACCDQLNRPKNPNDPALLQVYNFFLRDLQFE
jgi:hypothetical protein